MKQNDEFIAKEYDRFLFYQEQGPVLTMTKPLKRPE